MKRKIINIQGLLFTQEASGYICFRKKELKLLIKYLKGKK